MFYHVGNSFWNQTITLFTSQMATQKIDLDTIYTILLFCCRFRFSFTFYCSIHWLLVLAAVTKPHKFLFSSLILFSILFLFYGYTLFARGVCVLYFMRVFSFFFRVCLLFFYVIDTVFKGRMNCGFLIGISLLAHNEAHRIAAHSV